MEPNPVEANPLYEIKKRGRAFLEDVRGGDLQRTLRRDIEESYHFYIDDATRDELSAMGRIKRGINTTIYLFKSLFLKLTPLRRIMVAVSLMLVFNGATGSTGQIVLGFIILLMTLLLELKDKLLAQDELASGRAVQRALMPAHSPAVPGWETWLFTRPANDVGGDLVDHLPLDDGRLGLALGDIAGKGLPAALLMAKLQATLRALAPGAASLAELGGAVNAIMHRDGLRNRFASLAYLELTPNEGKVPLLNAGHMPPIIVRCDGVDELPRGGIALGLTGAAPFAEQETDLSPGDLMIVYSDGVTEARDAYGVFFDDDRLHALLPSLRGLTAEAAGRRILATVDAFTADAPPHDDLSLIVLKRLA